MNITTILPEFMGFVTSRRQLVRGSMAGGTIAVATAAGLGHAFAQQLTDVDILQFALSLEHLEAKMYADILATNILTDQELSYLQAFGSHEVAHVKALTDALTQAGAAPVQAQAKYNFPTFDSRDAILNFAKTVEDIAVGAYQGAAASISNKAYLAAAGSIVQISARHAAIINVLLGLDPVPQPMTASLTIDEVKAKVAPLMNA
jgi:hypothetical protein